MTYSAFYLDQDAWKSAPNCQYQLIGNYGQCIAVSLDGQGSLVTQRGIIVGRESDIKLKPTVSTGNSGLLRQISGFIGRKLTGEELLLTNIFNASNEQRIALVANPLKGAIAAIDVAEAGGEIVCLRESFIAGTGVSIGAAFNFSATSMLLGKQDFVMQSLAGNGVAFIGGSASICEIYVGENKSWLTNQHSLLAYAGNVEVTGALTGGPMAMLASGEGAFELECKGPGRIWLLGHPGLALNENYPSP